MKARQLTTIAVAPSGWGRPGPSRASRRLSVNTPQRVRRLRQPSQRDAERAAVSRHADANAEQRTQAQTKCYQLFAVEDCLRDVRNQWRGSSPACARARFSSMMPSARKNQQRLRQIEEKRASAAAATTPPSAVVRKAEPTGRSGARENTAGSVKLRDREAAARASQQRERQQKPGGRASVAGERNRQARRPRPSKAAGVEKALKPAAQSASRKADAAANGHKPAATCLRLPERR